MPSLAILISVMKEEELEMHVMWEFKNNKNTTETAKKICSVLGKCLLLTAKSKTGFQSFILAVHQ